MAVSTRDKVILWGRAAARCSHPGCRRSLVKNPAQSGADIVLGEIAHIVAQKPDGPRGNQPPPGGSIDGQANLLLLCQEHHTSIDRQPDLFPVTMLLQWKIDHEQWVTAQLFPHDQLIGIEAPAASTTEPLYSTLLPVQHIPRFVHVAECTLTEKAIQEAVRPGARDDSIMAPFIVRGGSLMTFCDLDDEQNPFRLVVDPYSAEKHLADVWWDDPDQYRWYVQLLNRSLNKLTGRLGLNLDKEHRRYYFEPNPDNSERSVHYTAIGGKRQSRKVAWQPEFKATSKKKHYWEHLAVGLQFHRPAKHAWCLSIRPERRFTRDGREPLTPIGTGRRSTNRKSHMYNFDVLKEVHFWRAFLSQGSPRIIFRFGCQSIVIDSHILATDATWSAIPGDMKRRMKVHYDDDLLSLADYNEAIEFEDNDTVLVGVHDTLDEGHDDEVG